MIEVIVALIGALGIVLVALIGVLGTKINGRLRAVQGQVQNDHPTNLREELDERHAETRQWFWALWRRQDRQDAAIDKLFRLVRDEHDRLDELEDTFNPKGPS